MPYLTYKHLQTEFVTVLEKQAMMSSSFLEQQVASLQDKNENIKSSPGLFTL